MSSETTKRPLARLSHQNHPQRESNDGNSDNTVANVEGDIPEERRSAAWTAPQYAKKRKTLENELKDFWDEVDKDESNLKQQIETLKQDKEAAGISMAEARFRAGFYDEMRVRDRTKIKEQKDEIAQLTEQNSVLQRQLKAARDCEADWQSTCEEAKTRVKKLEQGGRELKDAGQAFCEVIKEEPS